MYGYERYLEKEDGKEKYPYFPEYGRGNVPFRPELLEGEILWQEGLKEGQLAAKGFALIRARD